VVWDREAQQAVRYGDIGLRLTINLDSIVKFQRNWIGSSWLKA